MTLRLSLILSMAQGLWAGEIPAGTHVLLRSEQIVRSNTAKVGDRVHFRTSTPVSDGQQIVLPQGTYVEAEVVRAKRSGRVSGKAELEIHAKRFIFADGQVRSFPAARVDSLAASAVHRDNSKPLAWAVGLLGIFTVYSIEYGPHAEFAIFGGSGAALASAVVLQRGGEIAIRPGTVLGVYFDQAVPLD